MLLFLFTVLAPALYIELLKCVYTTGIQMEITAKLFAEYFFIIYLLVSFCGEDFLVSISGLFATKGCKKTDLLAPQCHLPVCV
jgi:hypothetical protein